MAITARDKHGTYGRVRKAKGPSLDRRTARYFAITGNVWSRGFETRREADAAEREMKGRVEKGVKLSAGSISLAEFLRTVWLANVDAKTQRGQIKASTRGHYRIMTDKYIIPALGQRRLRDLQSADIRSFYNDLGARLSGKSVRNIHVVLSNALSLAVEDGYILRNPAKGREVAPSGKTKEMKTWTVEEVQAFLFSVKDDRLFGMWRLLLTSGLRRGELLALRWEDLDLAAGTLSVRRSLVELPDQHATTFETPKSERSRRTIDLDQTTVTALQVHRQAQAGERQKALGAWPVEGDEAGLCFTDESGGLLKPTTITRRFQRLVQQIEVRRIRLHDTRHTVATLLLRAGVPVHVVSERLGHASTSITMDIYAHVLDDQRPEAAAQLASLIDGI